MVTAMSQPNYPPPSYGPGSTGTQQNTSNVFSILAIVFGVVAILFLPIIFGLAGIVLGFIGRSKGERLSTIGIVVAVAGTIAGFALGYAVMKSAGA